MNGLTKIATRSAPSSGNNRHRHTRADLAGLRTSFIDPDTAIAAGLRRVDDVEGSEIVGQTRKAGRYFSGIVFPYVVPGNPAPVKMRLRRDHPDAERRGDEI